MIGRIALVLLVSFLGWGYESIRPPLPKICGSPDGPPVTASRIRLRDGRHLAYSETGVPKEKATFKIVVIHGFGGSRNFTVPASKDLIEELGVYFVSYDRAGYGESDPNPNRSVKSEPYDIEQLADQLGLGPKFYVIGVSMGTHSVWGCLKYIPHRLAGAALIVPVINYWWPSFPSNLSTEAYKKQLVQDQWTLRIAHYTPSLLYWWMTQKWFPASVVAQRHPEIFSPSDKQIIQHVLKRKNLSFEDKVTQQGVYESLHRDMMVGFGTWDFDPMDMENPFPNGEASVHIWQGCEDRLVSFTLQQFLAKKLSWIKYHEVADAGHLLLFGKGNSDTVVRALLLGENAPN
ncbi:hypothetical protein H6P81_003666 [Aristolochia fimbriata]|uniref:AB hydrolase-1 domain-containing protein n=1 Tax=Aristolochia fimbriata TaxID=158543 RepID=A0AAV7FDG4_ARIFI|nr:hypothetical protein H6P81_003666 [Aristolochia fimbriata]